MRTGPYICACRSDYNTSLSELNSMARVNMQADCVSGHWRRRPNSSCKATKRLGNVSEVLCHVRSYGSLFPGLASVCSSLRWHEDSCHAL